MKRKVLVVDEKKIHRVVFRVILANYGYRVFEAEGFNSALETFDREKPIALITDYNLKDSAGNGLDLIRTLRERKVQIPMVVMSRDPRVEEQITGLSAIFWNKAREPATIMSFLP